MINSFNSNELLKKIEKKIIKIILDHNEKANDLHDETIEIIKVQLDDLFHILLTDSKLSRRESIDFGSDVLCRVLGSSFIFENMGVRLTHHIIESYLKLMEIQYYEKLIQKFLQFYFFVINLIPNHIGYVELQIIVLRLSFLLDILLKYNNIVYISKIFLLLEKIQQKFPCQSNSVYHILREFSKKLKDIHLPIIFGLIESECRLAYNSSRESDYENRITFYNTVYSPIDALNTSISHLCQLNTDELYIMSAIGKLISDDSANNISKIYLAFLENSLKYRKDTETQSEYIEAYGESISEKLFHVIKLLINYAIENRMITLLLPVISKRYLEFVLLYSVNHHKLLREEIKGVSNSIDKFLLNEDKNNNSAYVEHYKETMKRKLEELSQL